MVKKRGIAKKPTAADWVAAGGTDPEVQAASSSDAQTPKHLTSGVLAKSKDPAYTRSTLYLPNELHKRLKVEATMNDTEMSDIAALAIAAWLDEHSGG